MNVRLSTDQHAVLLDAGDVLRELAEQLDGPLRGDALAMAGHLDHLQNGEGTTGLELMIGLPGLVVRDAVADSIPHPAVPHFPDEHVDVLDVPQRFEESHSEWLARANFEGRQIEERHAAMCLAASPFSHEHSRHLICGLPKEHDGVHRSGDLEWAAGHMPSRVGGRRNPPVVGEQWTTVRADEIPAGAPAQVRAWLYAAVGPPVVAVIDVNPEDVYFTYVGMTPFDPAKGRVQVVPFEGTGWTARQEVLRVSLDYFVEHFTRVP